MTYLIVAVISHDNMCRVRARYLPDRYGRNRIHFCCVLRVLGRETILASQNYHVPGSSRAPLVVDWTPDFRSRMFLAMLPKSLFDLCSFTQFSSVLWCIPSARAGHPFRIQDTVAQRVPGRSNQLSLHV
jgi:hypothetical protein